MPERSARIALLILARPMCVECIAEHSGVPEADVLAYLGTIGRILELRQQDAGRCRTCGRTTTVFSIFRTPE